MSDFQILMAVLLAAILLSSLAAARGLQQHAIALMVGCALGFAPGLPDVRLDPDLVFLVFLPPLLYAAAFQIADEDLRPNLRPIGLLSVGLVAVTIAGVAGVAHYVVGLAWAPAFVLGALLGPTDPIAATAVIRRAGAPTRLATVLEGESLVNDGVALASLRLAVAAVGAAGFSAGEAALEFIWTVSGGVAIGLAFGGLASVARRNIEVPQLSITISLITAYGAFLVADVAGVTGILASVSAGLLVGARVDRLGSAETRLQTAAFWGTVVALLESALFLLIGLSLGAFTGSDVPNGVRLVGDVLVVSAAVLALRAGWVFLVPKLVSIFERGTEVADPRLSWREEVVLSLAGMRGAVTVAAALSIPFTASGGGPFPDRNAIVLIAYGVVLLTFVPPSLGLPAVLRRLGLEQPAGVREEVLEAKLKIAHAALARAEELAQGQPGHEEALSRARQIYEMRIARAEEEGGGGEVEEAVMAGDYIEMRRELLDAERVAVRQIREERDLPGEVIREIERDLDLAESRLAGAPPG